MSYVINGEQVNLSNILECDTSFQPTEEYINEFNYLNTDTEFTKNNLKKEDIGKLVFETEVEKIVIKI